MIRFVDYGPLLTPDVFRPYAARLKEDLMAQPAEQHKMTKVEVLMDAFENFAIGISLRAHCQVMRRPEPKKVAQHVDTSRTELRAALTEFTRPSLRLIEGGGDG